MDKFDRIRAVANRLGDAFAHVYLDYSEGVAGDPDVEGAKEVLPEVLAGKIKHDALALYVVGKSKDEDLLNTFLDAVKPHLIQLHKCVEPFRDK